eukprot:920376-Pyramimonas_sp.AAC.1
MLPSFNVSLPVGFGIPEERNVVRVLIEMVLGLLDLCPLPGDVNNGAIVKVLPRHAGISPERAGGVELKQDNPQPEEPLAQIVIHPELRRQAVNGEALGLEL